MEVFVVAPSFRCSRCEFPPGSVVRDVSNRFVPQQDFYATRDGHVSPPEDASRGGAVYRSEPRLRGGKGGFGSMSRASGAQIEKTTNREACRDSSGRRLRDVNHEKEMAEWSKKQAEREAEKEQRRSERSQRKSAEPRHQFTDPEYQRQCHDSSERSEDSVSKGSQASSSAQVKVGDVSAAKRPSVDQNRAPPSKRRKAAAAGFWSGSDESSSSEEEEEEEESPSSISGAAVTMTTQREEPQPGPSSSSSSAGPALRMLDQNHRPPTEPSVGPTEDQNPDTEPSVGPAKTPTEPSVGPPEDQKSATEPAVGLPEDQNPATEPSVGPAKTPTEPDAGPPEDQNPPTEPAVGQPEDQNPPTEPAVGLPEDQNPPTEETSRELPQSDSSSVMSAQESEPSGSEVSKEESMRRGLKCGGTSSERAARLFSVKGSSPDRIDPASLAKPAKNRKK